MVLCVICELNPGTEREDGWPICPQCLTYLIDNNIKLVAMEEEINAEYYQKHLAKNRSHFYETA